MVGVRLSEDVERDGDTCGAVVGSVGSEQVREVNAVDDAVLQEEVDEKLTLQGGSR